ncbi:hypothetical protein K437DRAFT_265914 [Tilletiaria anomala UBC 951]|uniref:S-adenosyl-L-methionine-dependent methyltransferase n=1 Tax=Tilletiaria anomala (strain ATCC 24038 / CBS 436.72 / UBC 951) TaxID=1037660 RepID=A0A066WGY7_TILAU|nr:uncharacterized protein K437DRAFT_265914 [Tilletiaria anomala UBC 951]KDN53257.1 hypothetical protein K437DRAFT_265914 [Tilletiaria anomala UBC 951]
MKCELPCFLLRFHSTTVSPNYHGRTVNQILVARLVLYLTSLTITSAIKGRIDIPAETPLFFASKLVAEALSELSSGAPASTSALQRLRLAQTLLSSFEPYATTSHDWAGVYERGASSLKLDLHFCAGPYEGAWLGQFVGAICAMTVLEVGMRTGTTTLCIAENLPRDDQKAHVTTLELMEYLKGFVEPYFRAAGHGPERITVVTSKASDSLKLLPSSGSSSDSKTIPEKAKGPFDLIFIDADKGGYVEYYKLIIDGGLLAKTGTLLIDNTLCKGTAFAPGLLEVEPQINLVNAKAISEFNDMILKDDRVNVTLLPVRDDVMMVNWRN